MESRFVRLAARSLVCAALAFPGSAGGVIFSACPGDGSTIACPCANNGAAGHGCGNFGHANGALLTGSGNPGVPVAIDTAVLQATQMSGRVCVIVQGDALSAPLIVDDGIGCVSGNIVRIGTKPVVNGSATYPQAGDAPISAVGGVLQAGLRHYVFIYRNAEPAFCPPATSNRTNVVSFFWHGAA